MELTTVAETSAPNPKSQQVFAMAFERFTEVCVRAEVFGSLNANSSAEEGGII